MKNLLTLLLLSCMLQVSAQKIDGFYSGVLHNDSAKMIQKYELAIAMYKGEVSGYSYVTFIVNDTFYYGIRKVKGELVGDSLVIRDDKFIANNFPESPAKGVKRTITMPLNGQDSIVTLQGSWKTNMVRKKYHSVPGTIDLAKSDDSLHSPLINHLKELGILPHGYASVAANEPVTVAAPSSATKASGNKKKGNATQKNEPITIKSPEEEQKESVVTQKNKKEPQAAVVKQTTTTEAQTNTATAQKAVNEPQKSVVEPQVAADVQTTSRVKQKESQVDRDKSKAVVAEPAVLVNTPVRTPWNQRKKDKEHVIYTSADSLVLAFYDNGMVDGDSISVYVNGEPVVQHARLTTAAVKKSISVAGQDEVQIVLVAENLGSIPPNTGLLTIKDGDNVYQVNFRADLQTNAPIIIRRKK